MIITTTQQIEGKQIVEYKQIVFGEVVAGANFIRDFFASITDVIGGRSTVYERRLARAREDALEEIQKSKSPRRQCRGWSGKQLHDRWCQKYVYGHR